MIYVKTAKNLKANILFFYEKPMTLEENIVDLLEEPSEESSSVLLEKTKNTEIRRCTCCGQNFSIYKTYFSSVHLRILIKVFKWAIANKKYEFQKKELQQVLSHTDYGNFCVLQRFGLIYHLKDEDGIILRKLKLLNTFKKGL